MVKLSGSWQELYWQAEAVEAALHRHSYIPPSHSNRVQDKVIQIIPRAHDSDASQLAEASL